VWAVRMNGLKVIITAGASGIGASTAAAFAAKGAKVVVSDINEEAVNACNENETSITAIEANVTDEVQVKDFVKRAADLLGGVDVLVNNAGTAGPTGPIEEMEAQAWRDCIDANLVSAFLHSKEVIPHFKQQSSGVIVNLSSTAGLYGYPLRTPYCSAKWAIIGLTKSLAMELGSHGIRANAICPGAVDGERMDRVIAAEAKSRDMSEDKVRGAYAKQASMRQFVKAEDIANMIVFLATPEAKLVSGQIISVDGHTEGIYDPF